MMLWSLLPGLPIVGRIRTTAFHLGIVMVVVLGGCTWSPFSPDKDKDKGDGGSADAAAEVEHCTMKVGACNNSCYKAGAGAKCTACCRRNAESCDNGGSYSFYSCPDEE